MKPKSARLILYSTLLLFTLVSDGALAQLSLGGRVSADFGGTGGGFGIGAGGSGGTKETLSGLLSAGMDIAKGVVGKCKHRNQVIFKFQNKQT